MESVGFSPTSVLLQLLAYVDTSKSAVHGSGTWVSATNMGNLDGVPECWLQASPVPVTAGICGLKVSLCLSNTNEKQTNILKTCRE